MKIIVKLMTLNVFGRNKFLKRIQEEGLVTKGVYNGYDTLRLNKEYYRN